MPTLFFVRHAESEANARLEYAGHLPVSLTEKGKKEANHTATNFLKDHTITRIYSSPLLRAQQTATFFSQKCNLKVEVNPLLEEQNMGIYSGQAYAVTEKLPCFEPDVSKRWNWAPKNGETYGQVANRACKFLEQIQNQDKTENILVVTHGVFLRLMRGALENTLPVFYSGLTKNCEILKSNFSQLNKAHKIESLYFGEPDNRIHLE